MIRARVVAVEAAAIALLVALFLYSEGRVLADLVREFGPLRSQLTMGRLSLLAGACVVAALWMARIRAWAGSHKEAVWGIAAGTVVLFFVGHQFYLGAAPYVLAGSPPPASLVAKTFLLLGKGLAAASLGSPVLWGTYGIVTAKPERVRTVAFGFLGIVVWTRVADAVLDYTEPLDSVVLVGFAVAVIAMVEFASLAAEASAVAELWKGAAPRLIDGPARGFARLLVRQSVLLVALCVALAAGTAAFVEVIRPGDAAAVPELPGLDVATKTTALVMLTILVLSVAAFALLVSGVPDAVARGTRAIRAKVGGARRGTP